MTGNRRGFDPGELRGGGGPEPTDAELAQAWVMGREMGGLGATDPTPGAADSAFVARVMAAIEHEPSPQPVAAGRRAVRQLRPTGVIASFRDAWRVAFGPGRNLAARAGALAYVLVAVVVLGSMTGLAVVGTASLLAPSPTQLPQPTAPAASPESTAVPPPSSTPVETPTVSPTEQPTPSSPPSASVGPTESDDHEDDDRSPEATRTPRPSETAKPTSSNSGSGSGDGTPRPSSSSD